MKHKEYQSIFKQVHITNDSSFSNNLDWFLRNHPDMKIEQIIVHKPYHVTIIYSELKQINP